MFSSFMVNTWITATLVALVAGAVGFFVVLRGSAFVAHAIPNGSFAGAAAAALLGVNELIGLGVFSVLGAVGIGVLSRRGRHDVAVALTLVAMLAVGALLFSFTQDPQDSVYAVLFGEILGVSPTQVGATAVLTAAALLAVAILYRPLLLASALPDAAAAKGIDPFRLDLIFLVLVALATTLTVPVSGSTLIFTLLIGPAGAARVLQRRPGSALLLSIILALAVVWAAVAASYGSGWPVGFWVGSLGAAVYTGARLWAWFRGAWRQTQEASEPARASRSRPS